MTFASPRTTLPVLAGAIITIACAPSISPESPFTIAPDSIFERIRVVAVAPVTVDADLEIPNQSVTKLESAIEEILGEVGFEVVPAFEVAGAWQYIVDETAGFYDSFSGERDEGLYERARGRLRQDLRSRFEADAILHPELWYGLVPFAYGLAEWDGARQAVYGAYGMSGEVRALSLVVLLEDLEGNELYAHGFGFATIDAWHNNDWLPLNLEGVVQDTKMVVDAVAGAFAPVIEARNADSMAVH